MTSNQIAYWRLQEDKRSNRADEAETRRSNQEREAENFRHNTATEKETQRGNLAQETLKGRQVFIDEQKLPFEKWKLGTESFKNVAQGLTGKQGILGAATPILSMFKVPTAGEIGFGN